MSLEHTLQSSSLREFTWVHLREHGIDFFCKKRENTPVSHPPTSLEYSWDSSPGIQMLSLPLHMPIRKQRTKEKGKIRTRIVKCTAEGREKQQRNNTEPK